MIKKMARNWWIVITVLFALTPVGMWGQFESGTVSGLVQDATGAVIPDAHIELLNLATNVVRTATTTSSGEYSFVNVTPGRYNVTAHQTGFANLTKAVEVAVGASATVDLSLSAAGATESIEVTTDVTTVETSSSDIGNVRTTQQIVDLPLNSRNFTQLVSLSPGVNLRGNSNNSVQQGYTSGRGANGAVINGNPGEDTIFLFDGIQSVNNDVAVAIFFPPVDGIQEFKVQTSGAPAAYGGAPAIINLTFRSGTAQYHGSVYEFVRNSMFDAKNYFDSHTNPIVPFHMNQFGANIGGPLRIPRVSSFGNRLFFFADYEGRRVSQAQTYISTVPLPQFANGDFSALCPAGFTSAGLCISTTAQPGTQLYQPGTYNTSTTTPVPYLNNQVPTGGWDAAAVKLFSLFPGPNRPGFTIANNYLFNGAVLNTIDQGDLRIDYRTDATTVFGRFSKENPTTVTPGYLPAPAIGGGPSRPGTTPIPGQQIVLGYGRTIGSDKYYEARLGWSRLNEQIVVANNALGDLSTQYGIPNANLNGNSGLTNFSITGQVGLGDGYGNLIKIDNNWEIDQAFSWVVGKHELKVGFDWLSRRQAKQDPLYPVGHFNFSGIYTGYGLTDFLFGHSAGSEIDTTPYTSMQRFQPNFYFQDNWRVTPKLTLNYGLRDDLVTPWRERHNRMAGFVPDGSGALIPVGQPPFQDNVVMDGRYDNFGPRVGFAYALNSKTAIRGGFGIYYAFENIASGQAPVANAPYAGSYTTTSAAGLAGYAAAPTISQGFPLEYPIANSTIIYYPRVYKNATSNEYNLDIQRQITANDVLSVAYVGQTAAHVLVGPNINLPNPGPGTLNPRRPYPNFSTIQEICMCANSAYNSLQVSYRSHIHRSLDLLGSYTYSHSTDNSSGTGNTATPQQPRNLRTFYGNSDFDIRHAASISATYTLPIGRNQPLFGNVGTVANLLVGGWQLNTIMTFQTGTPFTPTMATNTLNNGGTQYPNRLASGKLSNPGPKAWFNAVLCPAGQTVAAGGTPCAFQTPAQYTYGTSGRNILYGPGTKQVDLSAFKNFGFNHDSTRYLQLRAEAFNALNTPQFNNPSSSLAVGSSTAGTITSAGAPLLFQRTSREIQLAAKIYF